MPSIHGEERSPQNRPLPKGHWTDKADFRESPPPMKTVTGKITVNNCEEIEMQSPYSQSLIDVQRVRGLVFLLIFDKDVAPTCCTSSSVCDGAQGETCELAPFVMCLKVMSEEKKDILK